MERLTTKKYGELLIKNNDGEYRSPCFGCESINKCNPEKVTCGFYKALEKLAEYEDLEEQGKLLKLPCKPEDKLYWISDQDEDAEFTYEPIEEVEICNIDYNGYSLQLWFADKGAKEFPVLEVSSIGKELFYTREEAEATLKELKGGNGNETD